MLMKYLLEIFLFSFISLCLLADEKMDFDKLKETAETGDASAQCELGISYLKGAGIPRDEEKAFEWLSEAAASGHARAQYALAICYEYGKGVAKDEKKAFDLYMRSAEQGNAKSQYRLGYCYSKGLGVGKNEAKSFEWYMKAAEQENPGAQIWVAYYYENGIGVAVDLKSAVNWYSKAAEKGNATAQYDLAVCYEYGKGVAKDEKKAFELYAKAAGQGHVSAQRELGSCYAKGKGVAVDRMKAFEWFGKAADQKDAFAANQMACYYFGYSGFKTNSDKAMFYLETAADNGASDAQMSCAIAYFNGYCILVEACSNSTVIGHVPANLDKSIKYAKMGAGSRENCCVGHRAIRYISAFILVAGQLKKGDLKEVVKAAEEFPAMLSIAFFGYIALSIGFILLVTVIYWIYAKSSMGRGESGPWCLFDLFSLFLILLPLALITQVVLLLPFHLLTCGVIQMAIMFGFCIVFFAVVVRDRGASFKDAFALKGVSMRPLLAWTLMFFIGAYLFELAYLRGCGLLEIKLKPQLVAELLASKSLSGFQLAFVFVMSALVIPVLEELVFRGIIYQSLRSRMRPWIAICISSAIFASMHMSLSFFIVLFAMGAVFAYSLEKTKSLYVPICLHCLNNAAMIAITVGMR